MSRLSHPHRLVAFALTFAVAACGDDPKKTDIDTATPTDTDTVDPDTTDTTDTADDDTTETDVDPDTTDTADTDDTTDTGPDSEVLEPSAAYQVWTTDQGLHRVLVWEPSAGDTFANVATIDFTTLSAEAFDGAEPRTPHMVDFSPDGRYAFVAHTTSGHTSVIRTADYQVVAVLATGPGSHMARVSSTGKVYVDVIGNAEFPGRVHELAVDYETETFSIARTLVISTDPAFDSTIHPGSSPVCGVSTPDDSHQFVTFGPGFGAAYLARIDNETFTLDHIYDPTVIRANCGSIVGPDGRYYFTGGAADTVSVPGVGVWYVLDGTTFEPISLPESTEVERTTHGTDAHGIAFTNDGNEIWIVNRDSDNVAIFDASDYTLKENVEDLFDGPDLLALSPDGKYFFVTLRGPNPRSGPHSIAGTTPGLAVIDIASREVVTVLTGANDNANESDYHGLRVRLLSVAR